MQSSEAPSAAWLSALEQSGRNFHNAGVLVTGGAGFIGSWLARFFLEAGARVRILDNFATGRRENLEPMQGRAQVIEASITDPGATTAAARGMDFVFHQAALPSVPRSVADPVGTHAACATGTLHVLQAAREAGVRRVTYAASSSAYGANPSLPKREEMAPQPLSPYAVAKLAGEHYCAAFHHVYGLETVALRYFNVFGPRQDPSSAYAAVIPKFTDRLLDGQALPVDGDGEQTRDFTYIDNVVLANVCAALAPPSACGQVFNIACGERSSLNAMIAEIARILGCRPVVEHRPARAGDVKHSLADISRAREVLGYQPRVPFLEGLERTVQSLTHSRKGGSQTRGSDCQPVAPAEAVPDAAKEQELEANSNCT